MTAILRMIVETKLLDIRSTNFEIRWRPTLKLSRQMLGMSNTEALLENKNENQT